MSDTPSNLPQHQAAYVLIPQASCPIAAGEVGDWLDLGDGLKKLRNADGSDSLAPGVTASYPAPRLLDTSVLSSATYDYDATAKTWTHKTNNTQATIDSVAPALNDRVLRVFGDAQDGIYAYTRLKASSVKARWTRVVDMNATGDFVAGATIAIIAGTTNANTLWELTLPSPFVLDTGVPVFTQVSNGVTAAGVLTALAANTNPVALNGVAVTNVASITAKASTTLTIATGAVTATQSVHALDTEAAAASDDLDTVSGLVLGQWYRFKIVSSARNVVIKHGTGNILCFGNRDITLDVTADSVIGFYDGTNLLAFPAGLATQPSSRFGFVMYAAPPANEATAGASTIVTDVAISAVALTLAAQPAYPCKLNIFKTDGDSSCAATLTIVGKGPDGAAVTEVVTMLAADGTHTYVTSNAFATITSATVSGLSGNTGADKIAIGQKSALGLPIPAGATSVSVYKEGVAATSAAAPVNGTVGTVDTTARTVIPTTAPDGTKAFSFWFSYAY